MTKVITPKRPALSIPGGDPSGGAYGSIRVPNIRVVGPRLLVMPARAVEYERGGLIIPEAAQDHAQKGCVLVLGDGMMLPDGTRTPPTVEVGDEILYARYAGVELQLEDESYLIIQESDVRAVLTYRGKVFAFAPEGATV